MGQFHQYCVVEVFEKPQLYEIEISEEGSSPNPLTVSPGDWVCWIWDGVYNFRIQELSTQSVSDTTNRYRYRYNMCICVCGTVAAHRLINRHRLEDLVIRLTNGLICGAPQSYF